MTTPIIIVNLTTEQILEVIGRWVVANKVPEHEGEASVQVAFWIERKTGDLCGRAEITLGNET